MSSRRIIPLPFYSVDITEFPSIKFVNNGLSESEKLKEKINELEQRIIVLEEITHVRQVESVQETTKKEKTD